MRVRLKVAIAVGALSLAGMTTAALAEWSSSASGKETVQSGHDSPSHITASAFAPDLFPGATDTVTVTIDNPNPYPVVVTSISAAQSPAAAGGVCAAGSVYTDAASSPTGLSQAAGAVPAISAHGTGVFAITGHMVPDPADACKDQTFQLSLTASLRSSAS